MKRSEYTPQDTFKPLRTAGGVYRDPQIKILRVSCKTRIVVKFTKKHDIFRFDVKSTSRGKAELKRSEYNPRGTP